MRTMIAVLMLLGSTAPLMAQDKPSVKEGVEEVGRAVKNGVEDGYQKTKDATLNGVGKALDETGDGLRKAGHAVEGAGEKVEEKVKP